MALFLDFNYNSYSYTNNCNKPTNAFSDSFLSCARKIADCATYNFERFNAAYIASRMCGYNFPKLVDEEFKLNTNLSLNFPNRAIFTGF